MEAFGEVGFLEMFGVAFMMGGAFYFFYRLLVWFGRWFRFLSESQVKGASLTGATVMLGIFFGIYYMDLLTCDRASQGLTALRLAPQTSADAAGRTERYCAYYRDQCLAVGQGSDSANWAYCLRLRSVSPPV